MSWLDQIAKEITKNMPKDTFTDWTFGFEDILRVVELVEKAAQRNSAETEESHRAAALKAAEDPFHDLTTNPVFAPMAMSLWKSEMTFPQILRSALFIAIYSHTEYLLRSWCESTLPKGSPKSFRKKEPRESQLHRYLRYLKEDAKFELDNFATWPEWQCIDRYRLARNCLAHNGGVIETEEEKRQIGSLPKIEIDESGFQLDEPVMHLLAGACEAAAEASRAFIARIIAIAERDPRWTGPKRES
jgi:hypothetical protein